LFPHLLTTHVESAHSTDSLAVAAAEDDELAVTNKERKGGAGGVEGREFIDLSSVGVEVEGVVLVALVDGREIACDCDRDTSCASGVGYASVVGPDCSTRFCWRVKSVEVDLNNGWFRSWLDRGGSEERSLSLGWGWSTFSGFDGEEVSIRGEDDGGYAAIVSGQERVLSKRLARGEVSNGSEGGEGVADTQKKVTVAKAPKVLTVVVGAPGGTAEDVARGKIEEDGVDGAIHVILGLVGQTLEQMAGAEGKEKVLVVDVVEGEHRAARQKELFREGLEAELFQGQTLRRFGAAGCEERGRKEKKKNTHEREAV